MPGLMTLFAVVVGFVLVEIGVELSDRRQRRREREEMRGHLMYRQESEVER